MRNAETKSGARSDRIAAWMQKTPTARDRRDVYLCVNRHFYTAVLRCNEYNGVDVAGAYTPLYTVCLTVPLQCAAYTGSPL